MSRTRVGQGVLRNNDIVGHEIVLVIHVGKWVSLSPTVKLGLAI